VQPAALRRLLRRVREHDCCLAAEEHELGVLALAVPLRNMQGRTVAALNVVASPQSLPADSLRANLLPLLQEAARGAGALL
jgi:IclR family pca regulon transcriptional regulator